MTSPKETIDDLRDDLVQVKNDLKKGHIEMEVAREINNTAGKILSTIKVQLAQQALNLAITSQGGKAMAIRYLGEQKCLPAKT